MLAAVVFGDTQHIPLLHGRADLLRRHVLCPVCLRLRLPSASFRMPHMVPKAEPSQPHEQIELGSRHRCCCPPAPTVVHVPRHDSWSSKGPTSAGGFCSCSRHHHQCHHHHDHPRHCCHRRPPWGYNVKPKACSPGLDYLHAKIR